MDRKFNIRRLAISAAVAALYASLTILLAPISYGAVQCRVSEVLCILPYFLPYTSVGLFAGCFIANLITGNIMDIVFGSLATLLAAVCTAFFGRKAKDTAHAALACAMPVIFNAVIVGAVITQAYEGVNILSHPAAFLINALWVGLGEAVVMYVLGLPLAVYFTKANTFEKLGAV